MTHDTCKFSFSLSEFRTCNLLCNNFSSSHFLRRRVWNKWREWWRSGCEQVR